MYLKLLNLLIISMSVNREDIKDCLGGVDVTDILISLIIKQKIGKNELNRLAGVLQLQTTFAGYKDKDPFDADVAINLLTDLLDKESNNLLASFK